MPYASPVSPQYSRVLGLETRATVYEDLGSPTTNVLIPSIVCQSVCYGVLLTLTVICVYIFGSKDHDSIVLKYAMISIIIVIFAVSSMYLAISIAITDFLNGVRGPVPGWYFLAQWYLPTVNWVFSDCILAHRAWLLWGRRRLIAVVAFTFLASSLISLGITGSSNLGNEKASFISSIITLTANLAATGLISLKAWIYRNFIKTNLGSSSRRTKVERVLAILVESGALYCFFWISVIATNCGWIFRTQKTVNDFSPALESDFVTSNILQDVSVHVSGVYSVIIVVLVHLQMTVWDTIYTIDIPLPPLTVASVQSHNMPTSTLTSSDRASAGTAEVPQYVRMLAGIS